MRYPPLPVLARAATSVAVVISFGATRAQNPTWLRQFGSFSDDYVTAIARCETGGVLVAGDTLGYWLPGAVDPPDVFLAKFDDEGNAGWGVQFGTVAVDSVYALAADGAGGAFVAGLTGGSFGGPYAGGNDAWFARCDRAGNRLWVRQLGTSGWDGATGVAVDGAGGLYVAGGTQGILASPAPGGGDAWIARYDSVGGQLWLRQFGTPVGDSLLFAASDGLGGAFVAGDTAGSLGGVNAGGPADAWVARFDATGKLLWARQVGSAQNEAVRGLSDDGFGGLFVAGSTTGALAAPNAGDADAWVARYNRDGVQLSIMQFGSSAGDLVEGVAADGLGGAFLGGVANGSLFGPNAGLPDIWIARTQSAASLLWGRQFGSPYYDGAFAIAPAGPGGFFVGGATGGDLVGSGGGGGFVWDGWLARYDTCYADCNADGVLTVADFGCFQTRFIIADLYADCNGDGVLTVQDFGCFQTKFVAGCP